MGVDDTELGGIRPVTDGQQSGRDTETEVIPSLGGEGVARTRELPVVEDDTEIVSETPPRPVENVPSAPRRPPVSPAIAAAIAVLVVAVVAGAVVLLGRQPSPSGGSRAGASAGAAAAAIPASISSLDPSGGSGFRRDGAQTWRTQTYTSADFGSLKSGVGLLLDVGAPRAVGAVTFDVVGGAVAVELRAGDDRAGSAGAYSVIARAAASGPTTLPVTSGAKYRYWLIWVTRLAARDGGYRAIIKNPVARSATND
jgi:hypothetical protein